VGGNGVFYHLSDGRHVIDASNTGGPLGHAHPVMVETIARTAAIAPAINEGWFWAEREQAAEELIDIAFGDEQSWVGGVRFFLSGSEANDAALSFAQALTGRVALATRERAYHGMTGLARNMTVQPHWHGGLSVSGGGTLPVPQTIPVRILPAPASASYLNGTDAAAPDLRHAAELLSDTAATIIDYSQGGIYYDSEYQDNVAKAARSAGSLWVADEVVTGLGRSGRWFAFQGAESRPDIVTIGKPLAGGAMPAGAVVFSKAVLERVKGMSWQTYSTFRGHPLMVAAIRSYLRVVRDDALLAHVASLEILARRRLIEIAQRHPSVRRVDGRGLHWTVELHGADWRNWRADQRKLPIASKVAAAALDAGVMIGTSGEQASLFLAPPLIIEPPQLELIFEALDDALKVADIELEAMSSVSTAA